jgi:hypothetical protein
MARVQNYMQLCLHRGVKERNQSEKSLNHSTSPSLRLQDQGQRQRKHSTTKPRKTKGDLGEDKIGFGTPL